MAKKRDYFEEAEIILSDYEELSIRYHCHIRNSMISELKRRKSCKTGGVHPSQAFKCALKDISEFDPTGILQSVTGIPFFHFLASENSQPNLKKKTSKMLEVSRREQAIRVIVVALRNGWIKPLNK